MVVDRHLRHRLSWRAEHAHGTSQRMGLLHSCFVVGSAGGLGYIWFRERARLYWNGQTKRGKRIATAAIVLLYIAVTIISNRHKPDQVFDDVVEIVGGLLLWGMCRVVSRFVDVLNNRLFRR
jgi:hypothetical protein